MLFRLDYSSGNLNPSKTKSSSMPGGGKCARIQQTAHDGRTTQTSLRGTAVCTSTTLFEEPSDSSTQRGNQVVV